jgi:hypothetical protein
MTKADAVANCESMGAKIVEPVSRWENTFLWYLYPNNAKPKWLGLTAKENRQFYYDVSCKQPRTFLWMPGEPNNWKETEDCVIQSNIRKPEVGLLWNDASCTREWWSVCKRTTGEFHYLE